MNLLGNLVTNQLSDEHSMAVGVLLSDIGVGILVTDATGTVLFCNKAADNILEIASEKIPLEDWPRSYGIFLPDKVSLCPLEQSPLYRAIHGEEVDDLELFVVAPGSANIGHYCTINLRPLRANSEIVGAILILQDTTVQKKLADEAARSNEALQQFASVAAHDLQEPLRSVAGFVDLLAERTNDHLDESSVHYMSRIKAGVNRMRLLINELLTYSRIQSSERFLTKVNCSDVVEKCIDSLTASIQDNNAKVICEPLPIVMADASQLSQLFHNLIGNALKFAAKDRPPVVQITAKQEALWWLFSVKDNGIGMEMQFSERVFVLFQRLHPVNQYSGTGIGLAICKRIVDGYGGRIWVESESGKGSTFFFTIPVHNYAEGSR